MAKSSDIPVCILAGGTSRRFGANKALAKLGDKAMIEHVIDRIAAQTSAPIAINADDNAALSALGLPIVPDTQWPGAGPLTGIASALMWARSIGAKSVITVAVDLPFLPLDFVQRLASSVLPSIAATGSQWHPVNGIWNAELLSDLDAFLSSDKRSAHGWAEQCGASITAFEVSPKSIDPFWNVNTPEDMAKAQAMLRKI